MSPVRSLLSRVLAVPSWLVVVVMLAAILGIDLGPESYAGIDGDLLQWAVLGLFVGYALAGRALSGGPSVETDPDTPAVVGEHYRPRTDGGGGVHRAGVYRVVGTDEGVALLRVGDADGRRIHEGEVTHVDQSRLDADFQAATDPGVGFSPVGALRNALSGLYWNVARYR